MFIEIATQQRNFERQKQNVYESTLEEESSPAQESSQLRQNGCALGSLCSFLVAHHRLKINPYNCHALQFVGSAPSLSEKKTLSSADHLSEFVKKLAKLFDTRMPPLSEAFDASVSSVFDAEAFNAEEIGIMSTMTDAQLVDKWFRRLKREVPLIKPKVIKMDSQRTSLLGTAMAQRVGIMIHSLKKSLSSSATLFDVKRAILHCEMGKDELTLLIDTVPNDNDLQSQRKAEEWKEAVRNVAESVNTGSDGFLAEDEKFVLFLAGIPRLHERMQCMYITAAFKIIVDVVQTRLREMSECLEMLVCNTKLRLAWQGLLQLGNLLNEGTPRGEQKWCRISALRRAIDVRGNWGMTIPEYMAAFVGSIFTLSEWRVLLRTKDAGAIQTYVSCKDLLVTYVTLLGGFDNDEGLPPPMMDETLTEGLEDLFVFKMQDFARQHNGVVRDLVASLVKFLVKYTAAAIYFGDPESLLPFEKGVEGDSECEESPARDLFLRITTFALALKIKEKCTRVKDGILDTASESYMPQLPKPPELSLKPSKQVIAQDLNLSNSVDQTLDNHDLKMEVKPTIDESKTAVGSILAEERTPCPVAVFEESNVPLKLSPEPALPVTSAKRVDRQNAPHNERPVSVVEQPMSVVEQPIGVAERPMSVAERLTTQRTTSNLMSCRPNQSQRDTAFRVSARIANKGYVALRTGNRLAEEQTALRNIRQHLLKDRERANVGKVSPIMENNVSRKRPLVTFKAPSDPSAPRRRHRGSIEAMYELARSNVGSR